MLLLLLIGLPASVMAVPAGISISRKLAPPVTISGKVVSEQGEPLIGVTVVLKGTTNGTSTDIEGKFSLSVPDQGSVLVFSYIGFLPREVAVNNQTNLQVRLTPDVKTLEEVIVVGYGEQKKASLVASIAQVKGQDLLKTGTTQSVSQALQGMMPGLNVVNSDGIPGKGAHEITIRGIASTGSNAPLTIVDGVERSIHMLDPNEIESISILKDASATAVYGVRGANGVIMVTTKRGQSGKPEFNFSSTFTLKQPTFTQDRADYITSMELFNEASINDGRWDNLIPESTIAAWKANIHRASPYNDYFPEIDWTKQLLREFGPQQQYNINARGGTDFMKYFVSLGYVNEGDIFRTDFVKDKDFKSDFGHKRYNWRSNFDFDLTKTTEFSISFAGNMRKTTNPVFGPSVANMIMNMRTLPSNVFPIRYSDGEWGDSNVGGDNYLALFNEGGSDNYQTYEGFYDARLKQDLGFITKGLSVEGKLAYTSDSRYYTSIFTDRSGNPSAALTGTIRYNRAWDYANPITNADGSISYPMLSEKRWPSIDYVGGRPPSTIYDSFQGYGRNLFYQGSFNYNRKFNKHAVTGLALVNRQTELNSGASVNFEFPSFREDWVGRVTYGYANKYLMEVNGAYTGSEKFARGKRFDFFPSFSAGWVLSEESLVKNMTGGYLDFLKVRYSYGKTGNDGGAGRFAYAQVYTSGSSARFGLTNPVNYGPIYYEGRAANPLATWETSYKQNLGIDFDIFKKISGTLDLFTENREGILMALRTVPVWFGGSEPYDNLARTKNRGYELSLGWKDKIGSDFNYYIKGNLSQTENRILFYDDPRLQDDYRKHAGKPIRWDVNGPRLINSGYYSSLDDIYNNPAPNHGLAQNKLVPGDLMYVDFNANGLTDAQDEVVMEKRLYPQTIFGLNLGFNYKNFDFNALFYGVSDVNRTIAGELLWDFGGGQPIAHPDVATRWTPETAAFAKKPSLHLTNNHNTARSTFQYVDGTYVRLENLEMAYRLQPVVLQSVGINRIQLFANFSDLLTWTKVDTRVDPEAFGGNSYPVVKRYNFGLRAAF
ncbi:MAG: SusC/RagA family TonB-linked outer membrane protein [Adhaeribacter sp.]